MKIADSSILLSSLHTSIEQYEKKESLVTWQRGQAPTEETPGVDGEQKAKKLAAVLEQKAAKVTLSKEVLRNRSVKVHARQAEAHPKDEAMSDLNLRILKAMIEKLTGKKIKVLDPFDVPPVEDAGGDQQPAPADQPSQPAEQGWGLVYDSYESHYESESTSFSAQGVIKTADGQEIQFTTALNMSREFVSREEVHLRAGDALKDPLVINFSGTAAQLTKTDFSFDLDVDGKVEQVAFVGPGSGFLALDRNMDNRINDGGELFGPATGNGFEELAGFDEDGNGWIDENDSIYDRLRIWTKDASGQDQLFALGEKGIGAVYLGHVATPFALKDSENQQLGQVRDTGLFVNENGSVGTIQQIDMVV